MIITLMLNQAVAISLGIAVVALAIGIFLGTRIENEREKQLKLNQASIVSQLTTANSNASDNNDRAEVAEQAVEQFRENLAHANGTIQALENAAKQARQTEADLRKEKDKLVRDLATEKAKKKK